MSDPGRQQFLWPQPGEDRAADAAFTPGVQRSAARLPVQAVCPLPLRDAPLPPRLLTRAFMPLARRCPAAAPPGADSGVEPTFCLVCLAVEEADHVQLVASTRHVYTRQQQRGGDGTVAAQWAVRDVNP